MFRRPPEMKGFANVQNMRLQVGQENHKKGQSQEKNQSQKEITANACPTI